MKLWEYIEKIVKEVKVGLKNSGAEATGDCINVDVYINDEGEVDVKGRHSVFFDITI